MPATHSRNRHIAIAFVVALCAAALLALPLRTRAAEVAVDITNFAFGPSTLTVAVGDTVTWTNSDAAPHTVTAENGAFDSGNLDSGATFRFTFTEPGTYTYRCDYHSEMTATVVVAPRAAPTAAAAQGSTDQPDTALPLPSSASGIMAPMLIGLGLLALAFGVVPPRSIVRQPRIRGGWRR